MYKKSFYLTGFLSLSIFAGCSSGPTVIDSTRYKHEDEKPVSNVLTSKGSTTYENAEHGNTNHENANHETANHSEMDHSAMKSASDAANQPYDLQFLDTMIAHHEGAVEMAKTATTKSTDPELKAFAGKIVADQMREISEMKNGASSGSPEKRPR